MKEQKNMKLIIGMDSITSGRYEHFMLHLRILLQENAKGPFSFEIKFENSEVKK